jgi:hypothetical protein
VQILTKLEIIDTSELRGSERCEGLNSRGRGEDEEEEALEVASSFSEDDRYKGRDRTEHCMYNEYTTTWNTLGLIKVLCL